MKKYNWLIVLLFVLLPMFGLAQESNNKKEKHKKVYQRVDASYIIGGQVYNDNLLYSPGYSFSVVNGVKVNKNLGLGLGVGGIFFYDERFLPVYGDLTAYRKSPKTKKKSSFINTQLGYSFGWNNALKNLDSYEFDGGVFINAGVGRKTKISDQLDLIFQVSYRHQFAKLSYKVHGLKDYSQTLNYDMVVLSVGLLINN